MARDQHTVLGDDQIGLDEIGAHFDCQLVAFERVVGQVAGGPAMADHQGALAVERFHLRRHWSRAGQSGQHAGQCRHKIGRPIILPRFR